MVFTQIMSVWLKTTAARGYDKYLEWLGFFVVLRDEFQVQNINPREKKKSNQIRDNKNENFPMRIL